MKKRSLLHLVWLIPGLLCLLLFQQVTVYYGISKTMNDGVELTADVTDFRIKQIAAQTNGYVDLRFETAQNEVVEQRLSLHAQHASRLIGKNQLDIKYRAGADYDIVIVSTFDYHRNTVLVNLSVIGLSLLVLIPLSIYASRYAMGRTKNQRPDELELDIIGKPKTA